VVLAVPALAVMRALRAG